MCHQSSQHTPEGLRKAGRGKCPPHEREDLSQAQQSKPVTLALGIGSSLSCQANHISGLQFL